MLHPAVVAVLLLLDALEKLALHEPGGRRVHDLLVLAAVGDDVVFRLGILALLHHDAVAAVQVQLLVEADSDLEQIFLLALPVALADDREVPVQRALQRAVDLLEAVTNVDSGLDERRHEKFGDGEAVEEVEALLEVFQLAVELRDVLRRARPVLLPLVAPQPVQWRSLLDVDPLLRHVGLDRRQLAHVEVPGFVAEQGPDDVVLGGPDPVDRPGVARLGQHTLVALLVLHPLAAHGVRPVLREDQNIEVCVLAEVPKRQLTFGEQFPLKVFATVEMTQKKRKKNFLHAKRAAHNLFIPALGYLENANRDDQQHEQEHRVPPALGVLHPHKLKLLPQRNSNDEKLNSKKYFFVVETFQHILLCFVDRFHSSH